MSSALNLAVILFVFVQAFEAASDNHALWNKFKSKHSKDYHPHEETTRRVVFEDRLKAINDHNLRADMGESTFRQGLNPFSDIPHDEFVKTMNGYKRSRNNTLLSKIEVHQVENLKLPSEVNWVKKGLVSPVKHQGSCGSCWTFSTAGAVEGALALKSGDVETLSVQHLLDCSTVEGNYGCNGGEPAIALQWVIDNRGLNKDVCYYYKGEKGRCIPRNTDYCDGGTIRTFKRVPKGDENALKEALSTVGPISVAMDASHDSLQGYFSGVYSESKCDPEYLDHAVLLVGYGTEGGQDYWLIKNSWGTYWGEKGYLKIARNKGNMCGIATEAFYGIA